MSPIPARRAEQVEQQQPSESDADQHHERHPWPKQLAIKVARLIEH